MTLPESASGEALPSPACVPPPTGSPAIWMAIFGLFAIAMLDASWVGYLETDDLAYARAAEAWLRDAPFLGQSHWALRHFIVLPLAASFSIFGRGELSLAMPMLVYGVGLLLLTGLCVRRVAGTWAGVLAPLLIAAVPAFASGASFVYTDVPEAFFVSASFWAFYFATSSQRRSLFVLAGLLAGCALLTRETAVALLVSYALLFLAGYGRRGNYVWMGIGFAAIVGLDGVFLWLLSGDPLWRIHLTQRGLSGDSPYTPGLKAPAGMDDLLGLFSLPRPIQAWVMLFASPAIGLLPWFAVPAGAYLAWSPPPGEASKATRLFVLLAACWFAVLSFVLLSLWLIPRYQIVTLCALAVPAAILLADWLNRGHRLRVAAVLLPILGGGLALTAASDHGLMFGERSLAAFMRQQNEPVRTDPATLRGARWLLENEAADSRVSAGLPTQGGLYFVNHTPRRQLPADWPVRDDPAGSTVVASFVEPPGRIASVAAAMGFDRVLPPALWKKLHPAPRRAEMVRMP